MSKKPKTKQRKIREVAKDIYNEWSQSKTKIYFGAIPYLQAMLQLDNIDDTYGHDSAKSVILYGLSNMKSFRGERAKELKAELKAIAGVK